MNAILPTRLITTLSMFCFASTIMAVPEKRVVDGVLHRNGVGVAKNGEVVFVMTDFDSPKFPNLHEFASLFALLECEDALFLDGDLSQMRSGAELSRPSNNFGSIIAVLKQGK